MDLSGDVEVPRVVHEAETSFPLQGPYLGTPVRRGVVYQQHSVKGHQYPDECSPGATPDSPTTFTSPLGAAHLP